MNKSNEFRKLPWREGMRVSGKIELPVDYYGEYLARSGKDKHNLRKRKHIAKMTARTRYQ